MEFSHFNRMLRQLNILESNFQFSLSENQFTFLVAINSPKNFKILSELEAFLKWMIPGCIFNKYSRLAS